MNSEKIEIIEFNVNEIEKLNYMKDDKMRLESIDLNENENLKNL